MSKNLIWIDGEFVPEDQASVSVYDHGLLYGDGVFEGIRIYSGRILKLESHIDRLFESARSIFLQIPYSREEIAAAIRDTALKNNRKDGYVRLVVTRGKGPLGVNPLQCHRPCTIVITDSIEVYPASAYEHGLSIICASTMQKHPASLSPRVKSLNYLPNMMAKLEAVHAGAEEAVMFNHLGNVAECVGDNIFVVRETSDSPLLVTPPRSAGLLEGITMLIVLELAEQNGIRVLREDLTRHDLYVANEILLTGTGAEVVPVVKIDGRPVGDGQPGPVTRRLMGLFRELIKCAPED